MPSRPRSQEEKIQHAAEMRRHYQLHRDRLLARRRIKYQADHEHRQMLISRAGRWSAANPERRKSISRDWYEKNREHAAEQQKQYVARNIERHRGYQRVYQSGRRQKLRGGTGDIDIAALLARAAGKCEICGDVLGGRYHLDHIVPIARGGKHEQANLQVAHPRCNQSKGARLQ